MGGVGSGEGDISNTALGVPRWEIREGFQEVVIFK